MKKSLFIALLLALAISLTSCMSPEKMAIKAFQLAEEEKYDEAIELYNEAMEKDPSNANIYLSLSNIYNIIGEFELEKKILEKGIKAVEDKVPLQLALVNYYIEHLQYEEGKNLLLEVFKSDGSNVAAYESLLDIYYQQFESEAIIDLYESNVNRIVSEKGVILAAISYLDLGNWETADKLISNINMDKIDNSDSLGKLAEFYIRTDDRDNALLVAEKGLKSQDPTVFHGIAYGLKNDKGLNLVVMKTGDINGDGKEENVLMMADDQGWGSEIIELFIQEGSTGKIIDTISISEIGGIPNGLALSDLNHDGILDILASVHSGGTGGMEFHYSYSFKDNNKVDLLDSLVYDIDFEFLDGFKAQIFSEEINKAFEVEFDEERRSMYMEDKYYGNNGMMLSAYGYFRFDMLETTFINELNQYALKHSTSLVGPAYNADIIAWVETIYLFKDGKWTTYDLNVYDEISIVKSIPFTKDRPKPAMAEDFQKLDELFSMTVSDIYKKHGEPVDTGWFDGEYIAYNDIVFFVDQNRVTAVSFLEGQELFGIKFRTRYNDIKKALGEPNSEEYSEMDGDYILYYKMGDYYLHFFSPEKDGIYNIKIKNRL